MNIDIFRNFADGNLTMRDLICEQITQCASSVYYAMNILEKADRKKEANLFYDFREEMFVLRKKIEENSYNYNEALSLIEKWHERFNIMFIYFKEDYLSNLSFENNLAYLLWVVKDYLKEENE